MSDTWDEASADPLAGAPCEARLDRCTEVFTDCHLERINLWQRIADIEATNAALVEFVKAYDAHEAFRRTVPEDGIEPWVAEWEWLQRKAKLARQTLATDHGIQAEPGEGAEG